jgi:hypothetical protein
MAQPNPDPQWPIFRDYEVKARRGTMRPVDAEEDVATEWANLPRRTIRGDYVECINDIAVTREVFSHLPASGRLIRGRT